MREAMKRYKSFNHYNKILVETTQQVMVDVLQRNGE